MKNVCAVILAAGRGTRMGSTSPKVLFELGGKPVIFWILETLKNAGVKKVLVVVGYRAELVESRIKEGGFKVEFVEQKKLLGTGYSVQIALKKIPKNFDTLLVLFADDSAFYKSDSIRKFLDFHTKKKNKVTFLTSYLDRPNPIGGLDIDKKGRVLGILRQSQIVNSRLKKYHILCGAFCFDRGWIARNINRIEKSDLSGEYPLPYIYKVALLNGEYVHTFPLEDRNEWVSINTPEEFEYAQKLKKEAYE